MTTTGSTMIEENSLGGTEVLCAYLEDELEVQRMILGKLGDKERHLIHQDLPGLTRCLEELAPLLDRLDLATRRRHRLLETMSRDSGIAASELSLTSLMERCSLPLRARLIQVREGLQDVIRDIGRANRRNQVLVRNGVEVNRAIVQALFGQIDAKKTYDHRGASVTSGSGSHGFQREV